MNPRVLCVGKHALAQFLLWLRLHCICFLSWNLAPPFLSTFPMYTHTPMSCPKHTNMACMVSHLYGRTTKGSPRVSGFVRAACFLCSSSSDGVSHACARNMADKLGENSSIGPACFDSLVPFPLSPSILFLPFHPVYPTHVRTHPSHLNEILFWWMLSFSAFLLESSLWRRCDAFLCGKAKLLQHLPTTKHSTRYGNPFHRRIYRILCSARTLLCRYVSTLIVATLLTFSLFGDFFFFPQTAFRLCCGFRIVVQAF